MTHTLDRELETRQSEMIKVMISERKEGRRAISVLWLHWMV